LVDQERGSPRGLRALEDELDTPLRGLSYVVLSIKLDSILPGTPTIPDQIAADKSPYYKALEVADKEWAKEKVDVSALENVIEEMLAQQLVNAAKEASGEAII
jgi:hypothetical protein